MMISAIFVASLVAAPHAPTAAIFIPPPAARSPRGNRAAPPQSKKGERDAAPLGDIAALAADDPAGAISRIVKVLNAAPNRVDEVDRSVEGLTSSAVKSLLDELRLPDRKTPPKGARLWLAARLEQKRDEAASAEALLKSALLPGGAPRKIKASDGPACMLLTQVLLAHLDWPPACAIASAARDAGFRHPRLLMGLASAAEAEDRITDAVEALRLAVESAPRDVAPRLRLAELLNRERDPNAAAAVYAGIVNELESTNAAALEGMIRGMLASGGLPAAKDALGAAERAGASGPAMQRMRALMEVMTSGQPPRERLESYGRELTRILAFAPDDVPTLLDLAYSLANGGEPAQAMRHLRRLLELDPTHVTGRELQIELLVGLLRQEEAKEALNKLIAERPRYSRWRRRLADLAMDMVDAPAAEEQLRNLLSRESIKDPMRLELTAMLLDVLDGAGKKNEALELARTVYDSGRDDPALRLVFLNMLQHAERHHEAAELAHGWHRAAPMVIDWQEHYALALVRDQRGERARLEIVGWMEDRPDEQRLTRLLHRVLLATQRGEEAIQLARGSGIAGSGVDAGRLLEALIECDRRDEAMDLARSIEATRRAGPNGSLVVDLAIRFDRLADAESMLNESIELDRRRMAAGQRVDLSDLISRMQTLASVYQRTGRAARGEQVLRDALELAPGDAGINNDLGYTWAEMEWNLDKAEAMIRLAVAKHPREAAYLDSLAWVRYKQGDFPAAVEWLRRAVRWRQSDPTLLDHYGDALYRNGQKDEAVEKWNAAVEASKSPERKHRTQEDAEILKRVEEKLGAVKEGRKPDVSPAPRTAKKPSSNTDD